MVKQIEICEYIHNETFFSEEMYRCISCIYSISFSAPQQGLLIEASQQMTDFTFYYSVAFSHVLSRAVQALDKIWHLSFSGKFLPHPSYSNHKEWWMETEQRGSLGHRPCAMLSTGNEMKAPSMDSFLTSAQTYLEIGALHLFFCQTALIA